MTTKQRHALPNRRRSPVIRDAQFFLGAFYHNGHGVPSDLLKSHMWLSMAAMRGSKLARERLATVKGLMTKDESPQPKTCERH